VVVTDLSQELPYEALLQRVSLTFSHQFTPGVYLYFADAPVTGLVMLGTGFFTIFQAALNYLVDTFTEYAASAVAANTFLRSCFAGAFPLAVTPMYHNIGVGPASSITGGFAALLIPVPYIFYVYGKGIRRRSKWSRKSVFD